MRPTIGMVWAINGQIMIYNGAAWVPVANLPEEEDMADFHVVHKSYNVNSKRLLQRITATVNETAQEFIVQRTSALSRTYDYSNLVEYLDAFMEDLKEENVVVHYDVVGDFRNNDAEDVRQGNILIELTFQQFNCLNLTKVVFNLTRV